MGTDIARAAEQWNEFYRVAEIMKATAPWKYVYSDCIFTIMLGEPESVFFCSVLGAEGDCYGVAVYEGERGLYDLSRLLSEDSVESTNYIMGDHNCLTLYWGDRDEVPPEQKNMIRRLGLKFRGNGNWPYALRHESRYAPITPGAGDIARLTDVLKNLIMSVRGLAEGRLGSQWEPDRTLWRRYDPKTECWQMGWAPMPEAPNCVPVITIKDELLKARLKKAPRTRMKVMMDLLYLNANVVEKRGERPIHPLLFCVADEESGMIVDNALLSSDHNEVDAVLNGFISFVENYGRMQQIRARNPLIIAALSDLCKTCGVKLKETALPEMDEIFDILQDMAGY